MAKASFRMASGSRESVFAVQTSTAGRNHRSGHTEGRLTTTFPTGEAPLRVAQRTCPRRAAAYRLASEPVNGGVGIRLPPSPRGEGKGSLRMTRDQKRARAFGVLYLITFVTSIPAALLYSPVLDDPVGYIAGAGHDTRILFAALLELLLIIANIGTAVVIVPIMRRLHEELAIGYVTARLFECTFILVGILCVLGIITLRNQVAGPAEGTVAYTLAAIKDWTFLLGPGWVVGWGNGLILGYLMYRSELVPRRAAVLGLIAGPLISVPGTAILLTGNDPSDALRSLQGVATIPEFLWELFLGVYCTFKGFRPSSPILRNTGEDRQGA